MRQLTTVQKKLLRRWQDDSAKKGLAINSVNDLSLEQMEALEQINDTEILWQECNRFLHDRIFNREL